MSISDSPKWKNITTSGDYLIERSGCYIEELIVNTTAVGNITIYNGDEKLATLKGDVWVGGYDYGVYMVKGLRIVVDGEFDLTVKWV